MNVVLSICVPTFNRLDKLLALLAKLKTITHPNIEVIVSDDSTDNETQNYFSSHNIENITYYRNSTNLGQFRNCNACIARAKGEWIQILHDDDDVDLGYLSEVFKYFSAKDLVIITGLTDIVELGKPAEVSLEHAKKIAAFDIKYDQAMDGKDFKRKMLVHDNPLVFSHTLFRRAEAINQGGFDAELKFIGDMDFWLKLLATGNILFLNKKFGDYYLHGDNQKTNLDASVQQWLESFALKLEMLAFAEKNLTAQDADQYVFFLKNNFLKARLYACMLRKRNRYALLTQNKIDTLLKKNRDKISSNSSVKACCYSLLYWLAVLCPARLFSVYAHLIAFKAHR